MINLHESMLPTRRGWNPHPPDLQSDAHPTEPPRPALVSWLCSVIGAFSGHIYHFSIGLRVSFLFGINKTLRDNLRTILPNHTRTWAGTVKFIKETIILAATSENVSSDMCAQRRFRSACASAQSDQNLRWPHFGEPRIQRFVTRTMKTLIRLRGCEGWFQLIVRRNQTSFPVAAHFCIVWACIQVVNVWLYNLVYYVAI